MFAEMRYIDSVLYGALRNVFDANKMYVTCDVCVLFYHRWDV